MSIVHDFRVAPPEKKDVNGIWQVELQPPPQVISLLGHYKDRVKIVYASTGEKVPLVIIEVNCPEKFLWYYSKERHRMMLPGDFRVEWED